MKPSRRMLARATLRVGLSSAGEIAGRAVNVVLPFALFALHDIGADTDRFFLALAVGFFVQGSLANAVATGLVPELVGDREPRLLRRFVTGSVAVGALAGVLAVAVAQAPPTTTAGLVAAFSIAVMAAAGLLAAPAVASLNADHRYAAPGLSWALRIVPIALYLAAHPGVQALHWLLAGLAAADAARAGILLRLAAPRLRLVGSGRPLRFPRTALHLILGSAIAALVPLALRAIAVSGESGSVSQFEAAERVYGAVASLATIGVGNVALVYLARLRGTPDESAGWRLILRASLSWSLLWLAGCLLLWAVFPVAAPWLRLDAAAFGEVRNAFLALASGIPGFIITAMLGRRMLTSDMAARFVPITAAGSTFAIGLGWLLFPPLGATGLGLGVAGSQYVVASLMYAGLRRRERNAHPRAV